MFIRLAAFFLFMLFFLGKDLLAQEPFRLYVSPSGRDVYNGSMQQPFCTLERAKLEIKKIHRSKKFTKPQPVIVYLRGGAYALDSTFILRPEDSGDKEAPVVYRAYANEKPVVSGARQIKGWKKLGDHSSIINPAMQGKVWVASIPKGWLFH